MNRSKTSNKQPVKSGTLVLFSAPSGCGKTTLVDRLLKRNPDWVRSISVTTRPPRTTEQERADYFFTNVDEFKKMDAEGELLESAKILDHYYGTPKKFILEKIREGKTVLMAIDVQGARKVRKVVDTSIPLITIFVLPPSIKVLRERLEGRKTESPEEVQRRIELAQEEIKDAGLYHHTLVNKTIEESVAEIESLIDQFEKKRTSRSSS